MLNFFNKRRKKRGQSTLEYAILIVVVIGAFLAMQQYIKRGLQGRLKSAADDVGDQFSPGNMNVVKHMITNSHTSDTFFNGATKSSLLEDETTKEEMSANVIDTQYEYWGK